MESSPVLPPQEEILKWLGGYVVQQWGNSKRPLSGAEAVTAIQSQFSGFSHENYGCGRFKDFLQPGNGVYFDFRIEGTQNELYPLGGASGAQVASRASSFLKPEIWNAFARPGGGPRRFDRTTGRFDEGAITDSAIQVQVDPVRDDELQQWFLDFVKQHAPSRIEDAQAEIAKPGWAWTILGPNSILENEQKYAWKRFRLDKVAQRVQAWCQQHGISLDIYSRPMSSRDETSASRFGNGSASLQRCDVDSEVRSLLLRALNRMSTEELQRLPIPPCYLLPLLNEVARHGAR